ncbi:hypothetical protein DFQ26_007864 [Actinomortierella ambigua]|nr:hypothetical protein DFQ26_007864 [Actinomortierella ambigua]
MWTLTLDFINNQDNIEKHVHFDRTTNVEDDEDTGMDPDIDEEEEDEPLSSLAVRSLIGAGAYGHVYHASWKGRKVAIKKFLVLQDEVHQTEAIQREIEILRNAVDRRIIQFYGTTYHEGMLVLVMECAEGGSLQRAINGQRLTNWSTKTRITQEIAQGLAFIHHEGIIHRDLKSMNVLLTRHMEVKLCDFGLATIKVRSASMSSTLKGTSRWMAPELFVARPKYSTKSDMYALGMVMWEMAANCTVPFQEQLDNPTVVTIVMRGEREELPEETPDDYCNWVKRCWAQDPLERPEASEMIMISLTAEIAGMTVSPPSSAESARGKGGAIAHQAGDVGSLSTRANQGDVKAQMALAAMYEKGVGVDQSYSKAFKWYLRAAAQECTEAEYKLGDFFYYGRGTQRNHSVAAYWIRQAAERGHAVAQKDLGWMYGNGEGVEQDYAKAVSWYLKSAEQGNMGAQKNLGVMYHNGQGVDQDYAKAASWYRKSAEQGSATAQNNLGVMYASGLGVEQDYVEAMAWYFKSAEQGSATAQINLGVIYENGQGVQKDIQQAIHWYTKAADQGHPQAKQRLVALEYVDIQDSV